MLRIDKPLIGLELVMLRGAISARSHLIYLIKAKILEKLS